MGNVTSCLPLPFSSVLSRVYFNNQSTKHLSIALWIGQLSYKRETLALWILLFYHMSCFYTETLTVKTEMLMYNTHVDEL